MKQWHRHIWNRLNGRESRVRILRNRREAAITARILWTTIAVVTDDPEAAAQRDAAGVTIGECDAELTRLGALPAGGTAP